MSCQPAIRSTGRLDVAQPAGVVARLPVRVVGAGALEREPEVRARLAEHLDVELAERQVVVGAAQLGEAAEHVQPGERRSCTATIVCHEASDSSASPPP